MTKLQTLTWVVTDFYNQHNQTMDFRILSLDSMKLGEQPPEPRRRYSCALLLACKRHAVARNRNAYRNSFSDANVHSVKSYKVVERRAVLFPFRLRERRGSKEQHNVIAIPVANISHLHDCCTDWCRFGWRDYLCSLQASPFKRSSGKGDSRKVMFEGSIRETVPKRKHRWASVKSVWAAWVPRNLVLFVSHRQNKNK